MGNDYSSRIITTAAVFVTLAAVVYIAMRTYNPVIRPIMDVLPPFAIAVVLAFLLDPVVDWFQKIGFSREFGVAIVGLSFLIVFVLLGFLAVPKIAEQANGLSENFQTLLTQAQDQINGFLLTEKPLLLKLHLPTTASAWMKRFSVQIESGASMGVGLLATIFGSIVSRILWVVIIPLSTLWLLRDLDYLRAKIVHFTPERHRDRLMKTSSAVGDVLGKYVRGMLALAILYSVVATIVLSLFGLKYALLIGAVSGILYLVPYLGNLTIMLAAGTTVIAQPGGSVEHAILVMAVIAIQSFIVFDLIVTPRVVGGSVGVHPVLALFSLAVGARMFGVVGMVAAVPLAASVQVAVGQAYPKIYDQLKKTKREKKTMETQPENEST